MKRNQFCLCKIQGHPATCFCKITVREYIFPMKFSEFLANFAVAIWPVTGQGVENTKWPAVLYSQRISQNRKILANLNYHKSI